MPVRSLTEWLYSINRVTSNSAPERLSIIERAGFVCFTIESKSKGDCPYNNMAQTPRVEEPRMLLTNLSTQIPDIEEDFTTPGSRQGHLNCPFAVTPSAPGLRRETMPPTPKSSRSRSSSMLRPKSKRSSFHDPLRPDTIISPEGSIVRDGSNPGSGPACPIRFLGDHSPEDIAKYFDEHKHELPRSHELCIKRFQSNAESIRELDQKYGNLVHMIQGLGKMHKPMMPVTPIPEADEEAVDDFDDVRSNAKSNLKVRNWAQAVSNGGIKDPSTADVGPKDTSASESAAGERQSHWDRPLREIRVGESPSRPWGVPIPSKYLDRRQSTDSIPAAPPKTAATEVITAGSKDTSQQRPKGKCPFDHKAMAAAGMTMPSKDADPPAPVTPPKTAASEVIPATSKDTSQQRPKGKCPIDHKAMAAAGMMMPSKYPDPTDPSGQPKQTKSQPDRPKTMPLKHLDPPDLSTEHKPKEPQPDLSKAKELGSRPTHPPLLEPPQNNVDSVNAAATGDQTSAFLNQGVVIARDGFQLNKIGSFQNKGTVLIGYDAEAASKILNGFGES